MKIVVTLFIIFLSAFKATAQDDQTSLGNKLVFEPNNPYVHDLVMAKDGDTYYIFSTGTGINMKTYFTFITEN